MSNNERKILLKWLKSRLEPYYTTAKILLLFFDYGYCRNTIAEEVSYSYSWICTIISRFGEGGIGGVTPKSRGRPRR